MIAHKLVDRIRHSWGITAVVHPLDNDHIPHDKNSSVAFH